MFFNLDKWSLVHIGNNGFSYEMKVLYWKASDKEKDFGVLFHRNAKLSGQIC